MSVYATKLRDQEGNNPDYETLIRVYNMVFPIAIEERYVDLVNSVYGYWYYSGRLNDANSTVNELTEDITKLSGNLTDQLAQKQQYTVELEELKKQMIGAVEIGDFTLLKKLAAKAETLPSLISSLGVSTQNRIDSDRGKATDSHAYANEVRKGLDESVDRIQTILSDINSLPNGGEKRIDSFEITQKHLDIIDSLGCSENVKQVFKDKIASQLKFRVEAFKCFHDYAESVVEGYRNHHLYVMDHDTSQRLKVAFDGLEEFELGDNVFSVPVNWEDPLVLTADVHKTVGSDIAAEYLRDGIISENKLAEYEKNTGGVKGETLSTVVSSAKIRMVDGSLCDYVDWLSADNTVSMVDDQAPVK